MFLNLTNGFLRVNKMTDKTLEEIFWKEGKFVNSIDKKVKPKSMGEPKTINVLSKTGIIKCIKDDEFKISIKILCEKFIKENKINAYILSQPHDISAKKLSHSISYDVPIQFYKI